MTFRDPFQNSCDIDIVAPLFFDTGVEGSAPENGVRKMYSIHIAGTCYLGVRAVSLRRDRGCFSPIRRTSTCYSDYWICHSYQKKMFNNRVFGAFSMMAGFFGIASDQHFPPSRDEMPLPIISLALSFFSDTTGACPGPSSPSLDSPRYIRTGTNGNRLEFRETTSFGLISSNA